MSESRQPDLAAPSLVLVPPVLPERSALRRWGVPVALFLLTALSTSFCGAFWAGSGTFVTDVPELWRRHLLGAALWRGLPFSATLLGILLSHEFGHFFAARHHRVTTSPPYFIPMPLLIGTMGAVIRMRGRIPHRRALVDIGASGPIAGFVVAVPLLVLGLSMSEVRPVPAAPPGFPSGSFVSFVGELVGGGSAQAALTMQEGQGLLYLALKRLVVGAIPAGSDVYPHPVAMAAWFGLFITALNLLPVGQLDGGHVLFAVLGPRARTAGRVVIALLLGFGLFAWMGWLLWAALAWKVVGTGHPPVEAPDDELGRARRFVAWGSLAIFVATFVPVPLEVF